MDNSFLKFYKNDFAAAIMNDNRESYQERFSGFVRQLPNETFIQITNCKESIAFGGNIKVELIDICGTVLKNITDKFFYTEVTDIFGVVQLRYQFGNIYEDFGDELLFLKLTHTTSDKVWYSAAFCITENNSQETTLFHYKNESYFRGISYDKFENISFIPQMIRLACFQDDESDIKESETETELGGPIKTSRVIRSFMKRYKFWNVDFFTYRRMMTLLDHEIIYIDGFRCSNKPDSEKGERVPDSNVFELTFDANLIEEPLPVIQNLYGNFALLDKSPLGAFRNSPPTASGRFNRNITKGVGTLTIYNQADDSVFAAFTQDQITVVGDTFTIDISGLVFDLAYYYIKFPPGLFISTFNETLGIEDEESWVFRKALPRYNPARYNSAKYL